MNVLARGPAVRLQLSSLWQGALASGVYQVENDLWPDTLATQTAAHQWRFFYLYGAAVFDKRTFLAACQTAFALPGYFGHNWDAFEETINDFGWAPAAGYVLLYDRVANFAANRPTEWAVAEDILRATASAWGRSGTPFYVLLRHTGGCVTGAPLLT